MSLITWSQAQVFGPLTVDGVNTGQITVPPIVTWHSVPVPRAGTLGRAVIEVGVNTLDKDWQLIVVVESLPTPLVIPIPAGFVGKLFTDNPQPVFAGARVGFRASTPGAIGTAIFSCSVEYTPAP